MALPASLTARLGELLDGTWTQIVADAAANNGNTVLTFTINITDNPAGAQLTTRFDIPIASARKSPSPLRRP